MRRFVPILVAGLAIIATACSDTIAPTRSVNAVPFAGPVGFARNSPVGENATYTSVTIPAAGGTIVVGPYTVYFPASAVCEAADGYGPEHWDKPCATVGHDLHLQAASWEENGEILLEFLEDFRFDPSKTVVIALAGAPQVDSTTSTEILYWTRTATNQLVFDESTTDPSMRTYVDRDSGTLYRRIKHFSGYTVMSGREDDGSGGGNLPP